MQTIEAKAILSAADKTGGVFARVSEKIRSMNAAAAAANRNAAATTAVATRASEKATRAGAGAARANAAIMAGAGRIVGPAAVAYGIGKSYKSYAEADLAIRRIGITADASEQQVSGLSKGMRDLAQATGKDYKEIVKGLDSLVAGGMDLPEALPALPSIVKTAQAAGAEVADMSTTTLALNQNLKISTDRMQNAFDILVKGGKAGKFELKDMARYIPSIAPAAVAAGMKGEEGLMRITAALQTVRQGTGTTEEAAASMQNIFAKMESEETAKKFTKFGVDLRKEMKAARDGGKDLMETFVGLTEKATKGDLSKIPQLFTDMEFARGMRAMLSFKDYYKKTLDELRQSSGAAATDLEKVLKTPAIALQNLSSGYDRLKVSFGEFLESLGKMKGRSGTGQWLSEAGADLSLAAESLPDHRAKAQREWRMYQDEGTISQYERDKIKNNHLKGSAEKARLRLFEDQNAPNIGTEINKPLFTDQELRDFKRVLELEGPIKEAAKAKGTPTPISDPRKSGAIPEIQSLELPPQKIEAEFKPAEVQIKSTVEAGSELLKIVDSIKTLTAKVQAFMSGAGAANGPGGTGKSSPDASPGYGGL